MVDLEPTKKEKYSFIIREDLNQLVETTIEQLQLEVKEENNHLYQLYQLTARINEKCLLKNVYLNY